MTQQQQQDFKIEKRQTFDRVSRQVYIILTKAAGSAGPWQPIARKPFRSYDLAELFVERQEQLTVV